jgi:hypothetical protein
MARLFDQGDGLSKEVWVGQDWNPKLWSRGRRLFFHKKKSRINKILVIRLKGLFWAWNKVGCSFFLPTLGWAFGGFTLRPAEGSNSYILLPIISLDPQQSLAIQPHGLLTWTAIV